MQDENLEMPLSNLSHTLSFYILMYFQISESAWHLQVFISLLEHCSIFVVNTHWCFEKFTKLEKANEERWHFKNVTQAPWTLNLNKPFGWRKGNGIWDTWESAESHRRDVAAAEDTHLMLGDWWTARYLGSGEEEGLVNIDLGTVITGLEVSCLVSPVEALSAAGAGRGAGVTAPEELLMAVLGSLPETVTVVTTGPAQEAGRAETSSGTAESVLVSLWLVGM